MNFRVGGGGVGALRFTFEFGLDDTCLSSSSSSRIPSAIAELFVSYYSSVSIACYPLSIIALVSNQQIQVSCAVMTMSVNGDLLDEISDV